jgi:hypothetical protein
MSAQPLNGRLLWRETNASRPCPVCDKAGWCQVSSDGDWCLCRRVSEGAHREKQDRNGDPFYVHRLSPWPDRNDLPEPTCLNDDSKGERAEPDTLDLVYGKLLQQLSLSIGHERMLIERGLTGDLRAGGYRTLAGGRAWAVAALINSGLEQHLPSVPGLVVKEREGKRYWTIAGRGGLLVPVRDEQGRIVALMVRLDGVTGAGKYRFVSSKKLGGPGPGAPIHIPRFDGDRAVVRVTEGVLKAEIATEKTGVLTIGLPSVSASRRAARVLKKIEAKTARVAYDADARRNVHVARQLEVLANDLLAAGFAVELELWDESDGKGIDDLLAAGKSPRVVTGDGVLRAVEEGLKQAQGAAAPAQSGATGKRIRHFRNFRLEQTEDGKPVKVGLPVEAIGQSLGELTDGWPRLVYGQLFAPGPDYTPVWLDGPDELFAWIGGRLPADGPNALEWVGGVGKVTRGEFYAHLKQTAERYDALELLPHCPPRPRTFYLHAPLKGGDATALNALLSMFSPATERDRELIRALVLTLFWGGPPGQRPCFLFDSDDGDRGGGRGVGKSAAAHMVARLPGAHFDARPTEDIDKLMTRLFSPAGLECRVGLLDNVKTLRFSWADLESLITTDLISGRKLYVGEGRRPNTLTWIVTLNGASLSKDMAQRTVIIKNARPTADPNWRACVEAFIDAHRWEIVGDAIAELKRDAPALSDYSRWSTWEREVLAHVRGAAECQELIRDRQAEADDDQAEADIVREFFEQELTRRGHDPERQAILISSKEAAEWLAAATGEDRPINRASTLLRTLHIPELRKSDRSSHRGWCWRGKRARVNQQAVELKPAGRDVRW